MKAFTTYLLCLSTLFIFKLLILKITEIFVCVNVNLPPVYLSVKGNFSEDSPQCSTCSKIIFWVNLMIPWDVINVWYQLLHECSPLRKITMRKWGMEENGEVFLEMSDATERTQKIGLKNGISPWWAYQRSFWKELEINRWLNELQGEREERKQK